MASFWRSLQADTCYGLNTCRRGARVPRGWGGGHPLSQVVRLFSVSCRIPSNIHYRRPDVPDVSLYRCITLWTGLRMGLRSRGSWSLTSPLSQPLPLVFLLRTLRCSFI
eukprot:1669663-Prymnesium_polylepis.1